jgi:predicted dinucleotide-binding enzyme
VIRPARTGRSSRGETQMAVIGFIGSGDVGQALARRAIDAGHSVIMSNSRGPRSLADPVRRLGLRAAAAIPAEAGRHADLVVMAIPFRAYAQVPAQALAGRVVIDAGNYWAPRDGRVSDMDLGRAFSSEVLAALLPKSQVVKAFNTITAGQILAEATPAGTPNRRALPICGDDSSAKAVVSEFIDDTGFDVVDAGSLIEGRGFDPMAAFEPPRNVADLRASLAVRWMRRSGFG